eukprot:Clim_evm17s78 gene=Clim_evmTU17s78
MATNLTQLDSETLPQTPHSEYGGSDTLSRTSLLSLGNKRFLDPSTTKTVDRATKGLNGSINLYATEVSVRLFAVQKSSYRMVPEVVQHSQHIKGLGETVSGQEHDLQLNTSQLESFKKVPERIDSLVHLCDRASIALQEINPEAVKRTWLKGNQEAATSPLFKRFYAYKQQLQDIAGICEDWHSSRGDASGSDVLGGWKYWTIGEDFVRQRVADNGITGKSPVQVLLNPDLMTKWRMHGYMGQIKLDPLGNYLAVACDIGHGQETWTTFVVRLFEDSNDAPVCVRSVTGAVNSEFANTADGRTLLVCTETGDDNRPSQVYSIDLSADSDNQYLILPAVKDQSYFIDVGRTKDGKFMTLNANSKSSSVVYIADLTKSSAAGVLTWHRFLPARKHLRYFVDHHEDTFLVLMLDDLENRSYVVAVGDTDVTSRKLGHASLDDIFAAQNSEDDLLAMQEIVSSDQDRALTDMDVFKDFLALYYHASVRPMISRLRLDCKDWDAPLSATPITLPDSDCSASYHLVPDSNVNFSAEHVTLGVTSPTLPWLNLEISGTGGTEASVQDKLTIHEIQRWLHFDISKVALKHELTQCHSGDGVSVPITLCQPLAPANRSGRLLCLVYGAYGEGKDLLGWQAQYHLLCAREGYGLAILHVRGGVGLSPKWHASVRGRSRQPTFDDTDASLRFLHSSGVYDPQSTALIGASAGGVALLHVLQRQREQQKSRSKSLQWQSGDVGALIFRSPFVDVVATTQSAMGNEPDPLAIHELEEWGKDIEEIRAWDPWTSMVSDVAKGNSSSTGVPHVLISQQLEDPRVPAWHAAQLYAWLHSLDDGADKVVWLGSEDGGHFGPSGATTVQDLEALEMAFLQNALAVSSA